MFDSYVENPSYNGQSDRYVLALEFFCVPSCLHDKDPRSKHHCNDNENGRKYNTWQVTRALLCLCAPAQLVSYQHPSVWLVARDVDVVTWKWEWDLSLGGLGWIDAAVPFQSLLWLWIASTSFSFCSILFILGTWILITDVSKFNGMDRMVHNHNIAKAKHKQYMDMDEKQNKWLPLLLSIIPMPSSKGGADFRPNEIYFLRWHENENDNGNPSSLL